jgi:ribonuclease D
MQGWRYEMFGRKARALLSGQLALSFQNGTVRLFEL